MKKIFLIGVLLLSVSIFSCKSANDNGNFVIHGKIIDSAKNNSYKSVYLRQIDLNGKEPILIDSEKIAQDGSYQLKSNVAGQHIFVVMVDKGFPFLLINDNSEFTYDIHPSDPLHPTVSGSDATTKLYGFINEYRTKDSALTFTASYLDSLSKLSSTTHAQDSLMDVLGKNKETQINDINSSIKDFVNNSNSPISIFYVLNVMAPRTIESKDLLPMAEAASARFKDDGMLAAFASRVKEANASTSDDNNNSNLINQQAPDLVMQTPEGKTMKISDFKGKYLLVDFWASWCGPCREENPNVVKAYNKYKDKNFTILGVSLDNDKASWIKAIQADKLSWNQMSDLKQWESAAVQTYHFDGIPFNVLIDPSGKIIATSLRGDDLDNKLAQIFNGNNTIKNDSTAVSKS